MNAPTDKEKIEMLKSFLFDVLGEFGNTLPKGSSFTVSDIAVKHGLGTKEFRTETCSNNCRCAQFMNNQSFFKSFYCSKYESWLTEDGAK